MTEELEMDPSSQIAPKEAKRLVFCKILKNQINEENRADSEYEHLQNVAVAAGINNNFLDEVNEIREDETSHSQVLARIYRRHCRV